MKNKIIFILFGILILFGVVYLINYSQKFADTTLKSPELNDGEEFVSDSKIEEVILNGEFETVIYDEKAPRYEYFIDNSGEKTQIYFTEPVFLSSGNLVNVKAKNIDGKLTAESKDVEAVSVDLAPPVVAQVPETISEQKTAVILVKFNDSSMLINPFTVQQINNTIFNGPIQNFIRENSFNQTWIITFKDGTSLRFGHNSDSELISNAGYNYALKWSLDKIQDTHDNKIFYSYTENPYPEDNGSVYLSSITYNNDQKRKIEF